MFKCVFRRTTLSYWLTESRRLYPVLVTPDLKIVLMAQDAIPPRVHADHDSELDARYQAIELIK